MSTNEFIRQLERDLGRRTEGALTPREFPTLPGTAAKACLLPSFKSETDFNLRYGGPSLRGEDQRNLESLAGVLAGGGEMLDSFETFARDHVGQDVLDAAEAMLRAIGRIEQRLEPLFAGLSMATFGLTKSACIGARARIGDILDDKALAGEL